MNMEPAKTTRPRERLIPNPKLKLREQFHEVMRFKHFSRRTEEAYWHWIRGFMVFHREKAEGGKVVASRAKSKNDGWLPSAQ